MWKRNVYETNAFCASYTFLINILRKKKKLSRAPISLGGEGINSSFLLTCFFAGKLCAKIAVDGRCIIL